MIRMNQFSWKRNRQMKLNGPDNPSDCPRRGTHPTLADVQPGGKARLAGFCPGLQADRRAQLLAYGMTPGHSVLVIQHSPVTVVQVEHTELAMEIELACEILVDPPLQENLN
jgi:Fe2+ transport system protein FeoA